MVEEGNETDGVFVIESRIIGNGVNQTDSGTEGAVQVVQTGREDELVQHATEAGLVSVEQDHLEVQNVGRLDTSLGSNKLDKVRVVTLGHGLQGREFAILVGFRSLGLASAVELSSNQPRNGEQLGLLVESKCLLAVQMDGQSRDAKDYDVSEDHTSIRSRHTGLVNLDQLLHDGSIAGASHHSASDTQITIEPWRELAESHHQGIGQHTGVPDASAVGLNADLDEAFPALLAHGLDPQHRRVGVSTDHGDGVARLYS